jgi:cyclic pyranopterin phosphate synthase
MSKLTHLDDQGRARMVDVSAKGVTAREATARGRITMTSETLVVITEGRASKGDVLAAARIAGIMAAKKTHELIPLCHPLPISGVTVDFTTDSTSNAIEVSVTVKVEGKTGVEMEALTAVSVACLTVYDMCKSADRAMRIGDIRLVEKSGGKSGHYSED